MTARTLIARINQRVVGELREDNGIWSFAYAPGWLEAGDGYALGPGIPLQAAPVIDDSTRRPVQWYFDNLLPEEAQRALLAKDVRLSEADAFGLLGYYGAESAGSLTLLPAEAGIPRHEPLRPLADEALHQRIMQLPRLPLSHYAAKRMSLAGAQHKLPVVLADGQLYEPAGNTPSTHILKPDHPDPDYPASVVNEYFIMTLADRLGLIVPQVERRYVPAPVYLIQRFDRIFVQSEWQRIHCIDACQMLNLDRAYKYQQGSIERLASLAALCRNKPTARVRLYEWLVFIVLTGNGDAHLKNLSFTVSHEGIGLAPHYDLLCTAVYESKVFDKETWPALTELAWPVLGVSRFCEISRYLMLESGRALNLARHSCERILDRQVERIVMQSEALLHEIEEENEILRQYRGSSVAAALAGERRCLRAIIEIVVKDMAKRLAR